MVSSESTTRSIGGPLLSSIRICNFFLNCMEETVLLALARVICTLDISIGYISGSQLLCVLYAVKEHACTAANGD